MIVHGGRSAGARFLCKLPGSLVAVWSGWMSAVYPHERIGGGFKESVADLGVVTGLCARDGLGEIGPDGISMRKCIGCMVI